jgi:hypothetical protein
VFRTKFAPAGRGDDRAKVLQRVPIVAEGHGGGIALDGESFEEAFEE